MNKAFGLVFVLIALAMCLVAGIFVYFDTLEPGEAEGLGGSGVSSSVSISSASTSASTSGDKSSSSEEYEPKDYSPISSADIGS